MKIAFLGDITLDKGYISLRDRLLCPFDGVRDSFAGCDFVLGNLECLCRDPEENNSGRSTILYTMEPVLDYLKDIGVNAVSLANNHYYDNLEGGYRVTTNKLDALGIKYFGTGYSEKDACNPLIIEDGSVRLCIITALAADTNPKAPDDAIIKVSEYNVDRLVSLISKYSGGGYKVIMYMHWGGHFEGGIYPGRKQVKEARIFIRAGAEMIIGHHSHTFQPFEKYCGKYIFYSLGNFCADSVYIGKTHLVRSKSAILVCDIDTKISISLVPIENSNLYIREDPAFMREINRRNKIFRLLKHIPFYWCYYIKFKAIDPFFYYFFGKGRNPIDKLRELSFSKVIIYFRRVFS